MLKNKKNIYILLPVTILIWSILIYRVIKGLNPKPFLSKSNEVSQKFIPTHIKESESFAIKADYRDPFLGITELKKKNVISNKTIPFAKKELTPFPHIIFKGVVTPKGDNEKVFLITVGGQQCLFKEKSTYNDVTLLWGNNQQIILQFHDQKQTFFLEK